MPVYDYDCAACGTRFEVIHGVHADSPATCPACGSGPVRKAVTAPAVHYKGSGWAKKERRSASSASISSDKDSSASDAKSSDTKSSDAKSSDAKEKTATASASTTTTATDTSGSSTTSKD